MANPSEKTEEMERALSKMHGFDRRDTILANVCVPAPIGCGGPAATFNDELSKLDFTITGLCQSCQDKFYDASTD